MRSLGSFPPKGFHIFLLCVWKDYDCVAVTVATVIGLNGFIAGRDARMDTFFNMPQRQKGLPFKTV